MLNTNKYPRNKLQIFIDNNYWSEHCKFLKSRSGILSDTSHILISEMYDKNFNYNCFLIRINNSVVLIIKIKNSIDKFYQINKNSIIL